ncbi:minichromosome maintenance domain-containing protein 2 [Fundulus heteroclitus]|uniref:minichromosome maintenance domain-containing protein 2 n=1 Tax=Fundulus heteroclitus TaxID=8078 RepID=UPI00165A31EB|nr:minichromosome maintenance domain-containing protein 2 [Fundulus heteroclitus]XP_035981224.1 minichromosome maintenance domain-containing protein 2 [Fundulus heteroclitus]
MADILSLKESVLIYLDRSGGLRQLAEDCRPLNDPRQTEAVYRFRVLVNPADLLEVDAGLGDYVLHDPRRATALFQSVCFLAIKTLSLTDKIHTASQVNVSLNLTHLPPFPEYTMDLSSFHRVHGPMRPVSMEGAVIALTRVTKYTQGARFLCTDDGCPGSTGFHHIRVHAPGATESATVRNDFSCTICSSQLKEDVKFRVLGDKQLVELIHADALDGLRGHQQSPFRYQSVTLFLRDELCHSMAIGRRYRVVGIPALVHQWPSLTWSVEANRVQPWELQCRHELPSRFLELLGCLASSPWRFPAVVAHCFGSGLSPPGLYNTLKLCLLLSSVQSRTDANDAFHNLDLLVVTADTLVLDRLMTYGLGLACRGVRHQASGEMFACLSRDQHGAGTANIHAGSALLASGGICMLGDLGLYKKDKLDHIQSVLESRSVSVFIPGKKYGEEADQQLSFPVQCSFWGLADSSQRSGRTDSAVLGTAEMGPVQAQLAETFGLVIQCGDRVGEQGVLAQAVHTLQQAVQPGSQRHPSSWDFSQEDYQKLVAHCRGLQAELSHEAKKLIHGYYMASRRARTQSQGVKISLASIKLLISLAEAHCRLCLRTKVLEEDAVIAVLLCENSVTLKHGASALVVPPDAVFPCDLGDADGLQRRDAVLDELHQSILRFVYTFAPGADAYITEE